MLSVLASGVLVRPLSSIWARILKNDGFLAVALPAARALRCFSSRSVACTDIGFLLRFRARPVAASARNITMLD